MGNGSRCEAAADSALTLRLVVTTGRNTYGPAPDIRIVQRLGNLSLQRTYHGGWKYKMRDEFDESSSARMAAREDRGRHVDSRSACRHLHVSGNAEQALLSFRHHLPLPRLSSWLSSFAYPVLVSTAYIFPTEHLLGFFAALQGLNLTGETTTTHEQSQR